VAWRYVAPTAARIAFPHANLEAFPSTKALFRPKPVGFVRYFLDVAAAALIVPIFLWLRPNARRYVRSSSRLRAGVALVQVGTVALVIICCVRQEDLHRWFSVWQLGAGIVVGCSVLAIAGYARGRPALTRLPERMRLVGPTVGFGGAGAVTLGALLPAVFTEGNVGHAFGGARAQIAVVFDEVSAVANGRHPLVDFAPQYSKLLPYVFRPFAAAPGWSMGRFTVLMVLLSFVALYSVYLVLLRVTGGPFSALALYIAVVAICSTSFRSEFSARWCSRRCAPGSSRAHVSDFPSGSSWSPVSSRSTIRSSECPASSVSGSHCGVDAAAIRVTSLHCGCCVSVPRLAFFWR
jgi:hypothetical protein